MNLKKIHSITVILICHADLNGAMNIGRKVISEFNIETIGQSKQNKEIYGYVEWYSLHYW